MIDDEATEETGADDAAVEEVEAVEAVEEAEVEAERYTLEEIAEAYGPRWERFASHGGIEAIRQAGLSHESATSLIRQGAHLSPQDPGVYEQIGIDPNEVYQPPEEEAQPAIWNAPWIEPNEWEAISQLANSENPEHRQRAAQAIVKSDAPDQYKEAYWDNAYGQGNYQALVYQQRALLANQDEMREQLRQEIMQEFAPVKQDWQERHAESMFAAAKSEIPGFMEHILGFKALWDERVAEDPNYAQRVMDAPHDQRMREIRRLTIIAAAEAAPQRAAANAQAAAETTSAKLRARTETSRTSGAAESDVDESTRQRREAMRRVGARIT